MVCEGLCHQLPRENPIKEYQKSYMFRARPNPPLRCAPLRSQKVDALAESRGALIFCKDGRSPGAVCLRPCIAANGGLHQPVGEGDGCLFAVIRWDLGARSHGGGGG